MSLIARIINIDGKNYPTIIGCTEEEYKKYSKDDFLMPEYLIPASFLKSFLQEFGYDLVFDEALRTSSKGLAEAGEIHYFELTYSRFLTPENVRKYLNGKATWEQFVNAYAEHLKTL